MEKITPHFFTSYTMNRHSFFRLYSRCVAERSKTLLRQNLNFRKSQVSLIYFSFQWMTFSVIQGGSMSCSLLLQKKEMVKTRLFGWGSTDSNAWGHKDFWNRIMRISCHVQLNHVSACARYWTFIVSIMDSIECYPRTRFGHLWMPIANALSVMQ